MSKSPVQLVVDARASESPSKSPVEPSTIERGASAEALAVRALIDAGYTIVERNWRAKFGELDIIARDGGILVFVEVRSRESDAFGHAAEMVTRHKQVQVSRVAAAYLGIECPDYSECRFDVVAITGDQIDIIKDAWRL